MRSPRTAGHLISLIRRLVIRIGAALNGFRWSSTVVVVGDAGRCSVWVLAFVLHVVFVVAETGDVSQTGDALRRIHVRLQIVVEGARTVAAALAVRRVHRLISRLPYVRICIFNQNPINNYSLSLLLFHI